MPKRKCFGEKTKVGFYRIPESWAPRVAKKLKDERDDHETVGVRDESSLGRWLISNWLNGKVRP